MEKNNLNLGYKFLLEDSAIFGYPVGKIDHDHFTEEELKNTLTNASGKIKLLYLFINRHNQKENDIAIINNGIVVDHKVFFEKFVTEIDSIHSVHIKSYLGRPLTKEILSLAMQSGEFSRFKRDKNFKNNEFKNLYTLWIKRSMNRELATDVLVYEHNNKGVGLITFFCSKKTLSIGLLAVDAKYRGKGIGRSLLQAVFNEALKRKLKIVEVATQLDNHNAYNFYKRLGFLEKRIINIYHFWLLRNV